MYYVDLINTFHNTRGTAFVGLDTETVVKLERGKKNPQQGRVTKRTTGIKCYAYGNVKSNGYENAVNRARAAKGLTPDFEVGPLPYGDRIPNSPIIVHKGQFYLQIRVDQRARPTVEYFLDGKPIAKEDIDGLPELRANEGANQGLGDEPEIVRTFKTDSIIAVRAFGEEHR